MDINTGKIYDSYEDAIAAEVDDKNLVSATNRETLEELRNRLDLHNKYNPHQGKREMERRVRQMK